MQFFSKPSSKSGRSSRPRRKPQLSYQTLEKRDLLAGDVQVFLVHDQLFIRGDASANQIQVRGTSNGAIEVAGENGTTINGASNFRLENVNNRIGALQVTLGSGDDSVFVEDIQVGRFIHVQAGQGSDSIGLYQVSTGADVQVFAGNGNDFISVDEVNVGRRLVLMSEQGSDTIGVDRADVRSSTIINTGNGDDRLSVRNSTHRGSASLSTQLGNDFISADGLRINGFTAIHAGDGNDDVYVTNSTIDKQVFADGGQGTDQLEVTTSTTLAVSPRVNRFEGTDVANEQTRSSAVFDDLILDGARLGTIVELAVLNPNFSTLVGALQSTGLSSALTGQGPFTVFAPTNAAFDQISSVVAGLTTEQLANVLRFHVAAGSISSSQLVMMSSVDTLLGQSFSVNTSGGSVVLNGNATLAATDIRAKNGIIHVLNNVLVPVL